jgi:hypothetical protein
VQKYKNILINNEKAPAWVLFPVLGNYSEIIFLRIIKGNYLAST